MSQRDKMQATATKLVSKFTDSRDDVQTVTITTTAGVTEFDASTRTPTNTDIQAIVTGASKWADGEAILHSDLRLLVSGAFPLVEVGGKMSINGKQYTVTMRNDILATGVKSAVIYFVRR